MSLTAGILLVAVRTATARVDTLAVGQGEFRHGWKNIAFWADVSQVTVKFDSLYNWDVSAGANVARNLMERGVPDPLITFAETDTTSTWFRLRDLNVLVDGDPDTAFDPDDWRNMGVPRSVRVDLDLGAAFRVNRIRVYPRLDPDHRLRFPQYFTISTFAGIQGNSSEASTWRFRPAPGLSFNAAYPNRQPVVDATFPTRNVRYVRLQVNGVRPWELAELEVYGDGSVPMGVFRSVPLPTRHSYPIWGHVRYEGGSVADLPIILQTRTGSDREPILYFQRTGVGNDLRVVSFATYGTLPEEERAGSRPNPSWSHWETVTDGLVRSPGLRRYIQFRILFPEPGTKIHRLVFEYTHPPIVQELSAEIDPREVSPGATEHFRLSMLAYMRTSHSPIQSNTGFRRIQVFTPAGVHRVDEVRVDDRAVGYSASIEPGSGFTVVLDRRVLQDGTFVQIRFTGQVYRDGTPFDARVADIRLSAGALDTVYQAARPADVDPFSAGGELVVRFAADRIRSRLLGRVAVRPPLITPNGDGVNETCSIGYDLFKLTAATPVRLEIFDLSGRRVRLLYDGRDVSGHYSRLWDGRGDRGGRVAAGMYLCRIHVTGDAGAATAQRIVGVAY